LEDLSRFESVEGGLLLFLLLSVVRLSSSATKTSSTSRAALSEGDRSRSFSRRFLTEAILKRWGVQPHPCYQLGFGRCSCAFCIFASNDQMAPLRQIDPEGFEHIAAMETDLGHTMKHDRALHQVADAGTPYEAVTPERVALTMSTTYDQPILTDNWELPAGAYGDSAGPL